jgi:hypothetical protein
MMWDRCRELAASHGIETHLQSRVVCVHHDGHRVISIDVEGADGKRRNQACSSLISSMAIGALMSIMDPAPPEEVQFAARNLRFRDFLIIGLIVEREHLFPDNWIYVHSPEVRVGRVQSFKNWSPDMVSDQELSFIGLEYFVNQDDDLWSMPDDRLVELGASESQTIGLFEPDEVRAGVVVRQPKAYPVYDGEYEHHLQTLRDWLDGFDNLYTVGRNGQHRYNNQDHSMLAGLFAARNVAGAQLDLWSINEEQSFQEEVSEDEARVTGVRDRLTPSRVEGGIDELLRAAFALYDEIALGGAFGITASLGLAVLTVAQLLGSNQSFKPMLSLLGNYFFGFQVSWSGLVIGVTEVGLLGFAIGWAIAKLINLLIKGFERDLERRLATLATLEALDGGNVERK